MLAFVLASAAALLSAGVVVLHRSPVICAMALVVNLLSVAVLFLTLQAQFVATLQVIIYAGAIVVLIVFVIMLLGLAREPKQARAGPGRMLLALIGAAALFAALLRGILALPVRPPAGADASFGTAGWLAGPLFSTYFYPFEIVSLVLLAAMAGAILLAKKEL